MIGSFIVTFKKKKKENPQAGTTTTMQAQKYVLEYDCIALHEGAAASQSEAERLFVK